MFFRVQTQLQEWWQRSYKFFSTLKGQRRTGLIGGVLMFAFAAFTGGALLQYAVGGILVNAMFWLLISGSETLMNFMRRHGQWIDVCLSVGSFLGGGGAVSGWLTSLMATGFFTFFRMVLCEPLTEEEKAKGWFVRAWTKIKGWLFKKPEAKLELAHV